MHGGDTRHPGREREPVDEKERTDRDTRAAFVSGLFAGAALITKPPAMWIVLVAIVWLVFRTMGTGKPLERVRRLVGPLLRFGVGVAVVPVLALGYFAMKGALPALIDIVVGANSYSVKHEKSGPEGKTVEVK